MMRPLHLFCTAVLAAGALVTEVSAQNRPTAIRLGRPDAVIPEEFTEITSIRELPNGDVLVADRRERRLVLVRSGSGEVVQVGRNGNGPGEYQVPGALYAMAGDSTLFTDEITRRWYILRGARIVEDIPANHRLAEMLGQFLGGADQKGSLLGKTGSPSTSGLAAGLPDSIMIIKASLNTERLDTLARVGGIGRMGVKVYRGGRGGVVTTPLMAVADQAVLFPDGWVAVAFSDPYRVDWLSPTGQWLRGSPLPFERIRVNDREVCAFLERSYGERARPCNPAVSEWPAVLPAFLSDALLAAPDGRLLIRRLPSIAAPQTGYDVIDRRGNLVGHLDLPPSEKVVGFGPRSVYVVKTDEFGLQQLRRHPWP